MSPLTFGELQQALEELRRSGHARVPRRPAGTSVPDAYPGSQVPLFVPDEAGNLTAATLTWGFASQRGGRSRLVFNTRMETALSQARAYHGMWAEPITRGRCLVPIRSFYERWTEPRPAGQDASDARPGDVRFELAGQRYFLLACVRNEDRFSVVTTQPNADVAPVHNRMPLVLGPGESRVWLGPDYACLQDRSAITLVRAAEEVAGE